MPEHLARNILIYSNSPLLEQLLKQHLVAQYVIYTMDNIEVLENMLAHRKFDMLLFNTSDVSLIRSHLLNKIPIIALLSQDELPLLTPDSNITLLSKPLRLQTLLYTIKNISNSVKRHDTLLQLNTHYTLSPASRVLTFGAAAISLTEKEVALLQYLYEANGKKVGKGELLQHIWGYGEGVDTHTVETHIYRLRQKTEGKEALIITSDNGYYLYQEN